MILLRSLIFFVLLLLTTLLFALPFWLFGRWLSDHQLGVIGTAWGRSTLWFLKWICGLDFQVEGAEHIPGNNCIVMAKHKSAWETIALRCILPGNQAWVLKQELMRIPVFGWALARARPIAIDRSAGRRAVKQLVDQGTANLRDGRYVIIFPEGTRVAPGTRKRYGLGGAVLAEKSGYPVLPGSLGIADIQPQVPGLLRFPAALDLFPDGRVLVADQGNGRVQIFRPIEKGGPS